MSAQLVILVEVDVVAPGGAATVLRFADRAIRPMAPGDAQRPNAVWDDRLIDPPSLRRALFDDLASLAPALGVGVMTLANADGALDAHQASTWGEVRVWRWREGRPFAEARSLFRGRAAAPSYSRSTTRPGRVQVGLYDHRADLDAPLQAKTYSGRNGDPGVLYEGSPDGLAGRPKPLAYGDLLDAHLPAPQVNAGAMAYQLNDGAASGSEQIFDRGAPAGYADAGDFSGATFDGLALAAASYATDLGRGLLKINGDPVGTLTFGVKGSSDGGYVETPGPILARLLARAGVPAARIGGAVAGLASAVVVGAWLSEPSSAREAVAAVARSAAAALLPGRDGVWTTAVLAPPAAAAALTIAADEVLAIEADESAPAPAGEVRVGWGRVWTTFRSGELAPSLRGTPAAERLAAEHRFVVLADAAVKARRPDWRTVEVLTALRREADAQALANQLKALFGLRADGRPRRQWTVTVELTDAVLDLVLGATVRLVYPPLGLDDHLVLIGEEPLRPRRDQAQLTLWG